MKRETKNTTLNIRTVQAVRDMAAKLAEADGRSIASTIERLIRAEFDKLDNEDDANAHHGHARRYLRGAQ
jgi:hypothetical protein